MTFLPHLINSRVLAYLKDKSLKMERFKRKGKKEIPGFVPFHLKKLRKSEYQFIA